MSGRFIVLGAGPAGLWAALGLAERGFPVDVLEAQGAVGGNAGSFTVAGQRVDYGSHRLHPSTDPAILERLRRLLGDDLLERPRHGRIRLQGRWIHFPLRPLDLALRLPPRFALGVARDIAVKPFSGGGEAADTSFATVLEGGLGRTICREFYFPYARKIWGLEPEEISPVQARRRVGASSIGKMLARLLPRPRRASAGEVPKKSVFYYPRRGFGQISEAVRDAAAAAGARVRLNTRVQRIRTHSDGTIEVSAETADGPRVFSADQVWSTIPAPHLARMTEPSPPAKVLHAAASLRLRAMVLVYLVLEQDRFTGYDAHYFPGADLPFTRVSEPKVYANRAEPTGRTVLCAEIPCSRDDAVWTMVPAELGELVTTGLAQAGLPIEAPVADVEVRRVAQAYPVYRRGFEPHFERLDEWMSSLDGILSFGRQGLFAHDNTHHAMFMAGAAVDSLDDDGCLTRETWRKYREVFATHVVED